MSDNAISQIGNQSVSVEDVDEQKGNSNSLAKAKGNSNIVNNGSIQNFGEIVTGTKGMIAKAGENLNLRQLRAEQGFAASAGGNSAGVVAGRNFQARDVLNGLLNQSPNSGVTKNDSQNRAGCFGPGSQNCNVYADNNPPRPR